MRYLVAGGNFFTGMNPYAIRALLLENADLAATVADVALLDPWRWDISPERSYLVYALTFRRAA